MVQHTPNSVPGHIRALNIFLSTVLLAYGTYGLVRGDLYLPGKRGHGLHFQDVSLWIMYAAILCAVLNFLAEVVDHYDRRNNEATYQKFATLTRYAGWGLFAFAIFGGVLIFQDARTRTMPNQPLHRDDFRRPDGRRRRG